MKKTLITIMLMSLFLAGVFSQTSRFTYTVIEDDPKKGNHLFVGLDILNFRNISEIEPVIASGIDIHAYNIFQKAALRFNYNFPISDIPKNELLTYTNDAVDAPKFYTLDLIGTVYLYSQISERKRQLKLRDVGIKRFVTSVSYPVNYVLGARLGYHSNQQSMTKPLSFDYMLDIKQNGSPVYFHGFNKQSFIMGLSLNRFRNFIFDTDRFGKVVNTGVLSAYADLMIPLSTTGYFSSVEVIDHGTYTEEKYHDITFNDESDFLHKGITLRAGVESVQKSNNFSFPIIWKLGVEIGTVKHYEGIDLYAENFPFYFQVKVGVLGVLIK